MLICLLRCVVVLSELVGGKADSRVRLSHFPMSQKHELQRTFFAAMPPVITTSSLRYSFRVKHMLIPYIRNSNFANSECFNPFFERYHKP